MRAVIGSKKSTRMEIVVDLQQITLGVARGDLGKKALAAELRRVIDDLLGNVQTATPAKTLGKRTEITRIEREVFNHWRETMGRPTAKLTPDRRVKIRARAREGYTLAQMKMAIDGCASSTYHMGSNDQGTTYNDISLIFRTGSKLEDFMMRSGDAADIEAASGTTTSTSTSIRRKLEAEASRALADDDFERYEKIQRELSNGE